MNTVDDAGVRGQLVARLAVTEPDERVDDVLDAALALTDDDARAAALEALVPRLSERQLERALDGFAGSFRRRDGWRWLGGTLAPYLPPRLLERALANANRHRDEAFRGWALAALIPHLDAALLDRAVTDARAVGDDGEFQRDAALAAAAGRFASLGHMSRALELSAAIVEPKYQAESVIAVAPYAGPELSADMLALARRVSSDREQPRAGLGYRVGALLALAAAARSGDERAALLDEALSLTDSLDSHDRASALSELARSLPADELGIVLDRLAALDWEGEGIGVLEAVAPRLEGALREQGVALARELTDAESLSKAVFAFVSTASGPARIQLLRDALDAAASVRHDHTRAELYSTLATALTEMQPVDAHRAWRGALALLGERERSALLDAIGALAPLVARLGGATTLEEADEGIGDAARWWP